MTLFLVIFVWTTTTNKYPWQNDYYLYSIIFQLFAIICKFLILIFLHTFVYHNFNHLLQNLAVLY